MTFKLILISNLMLGLVLVALYSMAGFGLIYLTGTLILSLILCIVLLEVYRKRIISTYKRLYKFAGVYLFLVFTVMIVDTGFNVLFLS